MKELVGDKFYTTLSEKYNELLLDYVLLSWDEGLSRGRISQKSCN